MNPLIYRRKTARLLVLYIILSAAALFALSCKKHSEAPAEKYTWTSYKSAVNGLYNGSSGMFNSDVLAIAIDSQTNFWIGGAGLSELQIQK